MFTGTLEKVTSNHKNLRTDSVEGVFHLPTVGHDFILLGEGLVHGTRIVHTTPVTEVNNVDDGVVFKTANSTYKIVNLQKKEG